MKQQEDENLNSPMRHSFSAFHFLDCNKWASTFSLLRLPLSAGWCGRADPEAVLGTASHMLEVLHAASARGLPALRLVSPVVAANRLDRISTAYAHLPLQMERSLAATQAQTVGAMVLPVRSIHNDLHTATSDFILKLFLQKSKLVGALIVALDLVKLQVAVLTATFALSCMFSAQ